MEDIQLSGQLLRAVGRPACLRQRVTVSARRWEQRGVVRTILLMWTLRALHALGISPRMLHRAYYGSTRMIDPPAVHGRVIVFAKAPREGEVKTRLAATHGTARALDVHRQLLELTVSEAGKVPGVAHELCVAGPDPLDECGLLARQYGFELTAQTGADLGERMANAMTPALARGERVVLVGSDSPVLKARDIAEALVALNGPDAAQVVLSPTEDGGYVLIAAAGTVPPIFDSMQWSHAGVFEQTLHRLTAAGVRYRVLRELWDVDDAAGWTRWRAL
jgi:rSAM/selenodomain-associated transferase 1